MPELYELRERNKRKDLVAIFSSPMTKDKWNALRVIPKHSKRFQIELPNGWRLKYGEHQNILKNKPKKFGDYVRYVFSRYVDTFEG